MLARLAQAGEVSGDGAGSSTPRLVPVRGLIGEYLHNQLQQLEQRDGDFAKCRVILEALSRSSGQKLSLSVGEIAAEVRLSPAAVIPLLTELHQARLIRPVGIDTWEIQHDWLAEVIIADMSEANREFKSARELLAAKAINHARTREWLTPNEMHLLYIHQARLTPSHHELYLLLGSLVKGVRYTRSWRSATDKFRHVSPGWLIVSERLFCDRQLRILRELANDSDKSAQVAAVEAISRFLQAEDLPLLRELAEDEDEYVRQAAVGEISRFQQAEDLPLLRELTCDKYSDVRQAAVEALWKTEPRGELRNWFMNSLADLPIDVVVWLDYQFFAPDWWRNVVEPKEHDGGPLALPDSHEAWASLSGILTKQTRPIGW